MKISNAIAATALALSVFAAPTFPASADPAQAPGLIIHIKDFKYAPPVVTIKAGTTVEFINDDQDAHTVTLTDKSADSGGIDTAGTWFHTFGKAGTYSYFCAIHPYMKGVIKVVP